MRRGKGCQRVWCVVRSAYLLDPYSRSFLLHPIAFKDFVESVVDACEVGF